MKCNCILFRMNLLDPNQINEQTDDYVNQFQDQFQQNTNYIKDRTQRRATDNLLFIGINAQIILILL